MNRHYKVKVTENSTARRVGGWVLRLVRFCRVRKDRRVALRLTTLGRNLRFATSACPTCSSNAALTATLQHDFAIVRHTVTGSPNLTLQGSAGFRKTGPHTRLTPTRGLLCNRLLHRVFLNPTLSGCLRLQTAGRSWESQKFGHENVLSSGVSHSVSRVLAGWKFLLSALCIFSANDKDHSPQ